MSSFLTTLLKLLPFVPQIAAQVESEHSGATVEKKTQIASDYLTLATNVATAVLPAEEGQIAGMAGEVAQSVMATTVQAIHTANNPAPAAG
jgi:hypothetical protein